MGYIKHERENFMKTTTILVATALAVLSGAAQAQSYGSSDPAYANTTDPNSAPTRMMRQRQTAGMNHHRAGWQHRSEGWRGENGGWQGRQSWSGQNAGWQGRDSYASTAYGMGWNGRNGSRGGWNGNNWNTYGNSSGGTGSPVSAGSSRGSTDRSDPNSPYASGPYGDGEWQSR